MNDLVKSAPPATADIISPNELPARINAEHEQVKQALQRGAVRARQPLTARGVYSATSNLTILAQMRWRNADGCGLATGKVSGIDVLDVDVRARTPEDRKDPPHDSVGEDRDGFAALANLPPLSSTLSASTPRNGRHFYFRHVVGGRNRKLGDGSVEWFSTGKLVVVPPAPGRAWLNQAEIAEAPDWLKALVSAPKPIHTHTDDHGGGSSPRAHISLGTRNHLRLL